MIKSIFIDHAGRIPEISKILEISEEFLLKSFNEAHEQGKYCRIKCVLTGKQNQAIKRMFKM